MFRVFPVRDRDEDINSLENIAGVNIF